jgi:hypothetical protein
MRGAPTRLLGMPELRRSVSAAATSRGIRTVIASAVRGGWTRSLALSATQKLT